MSEQVLEQKSDTMESRTLRERDDERVATWCVSQPPADWRLTGFEDWLRDIC
jgi:hypothetical protein